MAAFMDLNPKDEALETQLATARARDEYLAVLLIVKSDPRRYGTLVKDMQDDHTRGLNGYPVMLSEAYDILVNYQVPTVARREQFSPELNFLQTNSGNGNGNDQGRF